MKKIPLLLLLFLPLTAHNQTKRVLFIGNSYTYCWDMPVMTDLMARTTGNTLIYSVNAIGGYTLEQHSNNTTTRNLIRQGGWDYVVLQEYSQYPSEPFTTFQNTVLPFVQILDNEINTYNPNGETMFYMTWGRRDGDATRCSRLPVVCNYLGMDALTRERYMYMANAYHGVVSPAGAVWRYIRQNHPTIELYDTDGSHPNAAGAFATACTFYTAIFRKDPTLVTYNYNLNATDAAKIKAAAKAVVYDSLLYWHIGEYDIVDNQPPSIPSGLNATNLTETGFTLRWNASTDNVAVSEYMVYQDGIQVGTTTNTSFNLSGLTVAHTYAMTVKSKDRSGNVSSSSSVLNVTTPDLQTPSIPSVLSADNITENSFTLSWNPSADNVAVTGYDVYRNGTYLSSVTGTSASITGLSPAVSYSMTVRAKDAAGNTSAQSTILIVNTPDTHAPGAPSNLQATNITTAGFTLIWSASSDNVGVVGYDVYRNSAFVETVTGTTIGITGLSASTSHAMTVRAKDAAGNISAASTVLNVTTQAAPQADAEAPTVPSDLASNDVTQTSFTLSWGASTDNVGVTDYDVYMNGAVVETVVASIVSFSGLQASTTYSMRVRANDLAGNHSGQSTPLAIVTLNPIAPDTQAPSIPDGLSSSNVTETGFDMNWNTSTDNVAVTGYNVYKDGALLTSVSAASVHIPGLTSGTTYSMTVSAKDAAGNTSAASTALMVTSSGTAPDYEAPAIPVGLQATGLSQSGFTLSWTASTDNVAVTSYEVYRNGILVTSVSATSVVISGLSASTTYGMTVKAKDAAGNTSASSGIFNVTTPDTQAPDAPGSLSYINLAQASFTLRWNAATDNVGVVGYDVYKNGIFEATIIGTSIGISDLAAKTTYSMTVKARDAAGNTSGSSAVLNVTTLDTEAPSIPTGLSYNSLTQSGFTLTWGGSSDNIAVTGYIVYLNGTQNSTVTGTSAVISGLNASTMYQVTVAARDASGNQSLPGSVLSVTTPDTQAPSTPTGLSASNLTQSSFTLNWIGSSDNVGVTVYLVYNNGNLVSTVTGTAAGILNLTVNTTYSITVRTRDAAGNVSGAGTLSVTTPDTENPSAPTGLQYSNLTQSGFTLRWNASNDNVGITGYNVYRNGQLYQYTTSTTYNITGLSASATYAMTVRARDQVGNMSSASEVLNVTTPDTESPSVPASLSVTNLKQSRFTLRWAASTDNVGVKDYLVYQNGQLDTTVTSNTAEITGLLALHTYAMTVKARDKAGNISAASQALNVTTPDTESPAVPTAVSFSNLTQSGFTLQWTASTDNIGVVDYLVYINGVLDTTVTNTSVKYKGLAASVTYAMTVKARDGAGNLSPASAVVNVTTPDTESPSVPTALNFKNLSQSGFTLYWTASADNVGVVAYLIYRNGSLDTTVTASSVALSGLAAATTYTMTVKAKDLAGNISAESSALKVTTPDTESPTVPKGLVAENLTETGLLLKWESSSDNVGVSNYEVFIDGQLHSIHIGTEANITGLKVYTKYRLALKARDAAGNASGLSTSLKVRTSDNHAPEIPNYYIAENVTDSGFILRWKPTSDNVGIAVYEIYHNGIKEAEVADTSLEFNNLRAFTDHLLNIVAIDSAGNASDKSNDFHVRTTDSRCPGTPCGLVLDSVAYREFCLIWNPVSDNVGVAGYEVYLDDRLVALETDTTISIANLVPGKSYFVYLRAKDLAGNFSQYSDTLLVITIFTDIVPETESQIRIYPNPLTDNKLYIDFGEEVKSQAFIEIIDQRGSVVYKEVIDHPDRIITLSSPFLARGNYIVRIILREKIFLQKLIVLGN